MTLRAAVSSVDLAAALNRCAMHGDPRELLQLTDEQYAAYLATFGEDDNANRVIANAISRPIPCGSSGEETSTGSRG